MGGGRGGGRRGGRSAPPMTGMATCAAVAGPSHCPPAALSHPRSVTTLNVLRINEALLEFHNFVFDSLHGLHVLITYIVLHFVLKFQIYIRENFLCNFLFFVLFLLIL